jgi:hypothetical protein
MSGNKAILFSMIAILVLALISLQFMGMQKITLTTEAEAFQTRFRIANGLANDLESQILPRLLEADVGRALYAVAMYVNNSKEYLTNEAELIRLVNNSVMNGTVPADVALYRGNATLPNQIANLQKQVNDQLRIDVTITPLNLTIWQDNSTGPTKIKAMMRAQLNLNAGVASWNRLLKNVTTTVEIENLLDPYLMVQAPGTNSTIFFFDGPYNITTLPHVVYNRTYTYEEQAPSFLQRFYNDTRKSHCCGIESVLVLNGNVAPTRLLRSSMIDWCYYSHNCDLIGVAKTYYTLETVAPVMTSRDQSLPFYAFMLDYYHLTKYNMTQYAVPENECSCNRALRPQRWDGPGCIGIAENEICE